MADSQFTADREISAIPTVYKGIQLKSRMEAQCALLFDMIGWKWEYEKYSLMLPSGVTFIPDFWIESELTLIECRGYESKRGKRQINGLMEYIRDHGSIELDSTWCATTFISIGPEGVSLTTENSSVESFVLYLSRKCGLWSAHPHYPRIVAAFAVGASEGKVILNGQPIEEATIFRAACEQILPVREEFMRRVAAMMAGSQK